MKYEKGPSIIDILVIAVVLSSLIGMGFLIYIKSKEAQDDTSKPHIVNPNYLICFDGKLAYHYDRGVAYKIDANGKPFSC